MKAMNSIILKMKDMAITKTINTKIRLIRLIRKVLETVRQDHL